jgi:hypothetical protein
MGWKVKLFAQDRNGRADAWGTRKMADMSHVIAPERQKRRRRESRTWLEIHKNCLEAGFVGWTKPDMALLGANPARFLPSLVAVDPTDLAPFHLGSRMTGTRAIRSGDLNRR